MKFDRALLTPSSVCTLFLCGAFAWLNSRVQDCLNGLAEVQVGLRAMEKTAPAPASSPTASRSGPAPIQELDLDPTAFARPEDIAALRRDFSDLKRMLQDRGVGSPSGVPEPVTADAVSGTREDEVRALVQQVLDERDQTRFQKVTEHASTFRTERRNKLMNDLERRLKLTAFQKDAIAKLDETRDQGADFLASAPGEQIPLPSPEELAKRFGERESDFDGKVKNYLTPQQSTDYDAWKKETGGFGGAGMSVFFVKGQGGVFSSTVEVEEKK